MEIPLSGPDITNLEIEYVNRVLQGPYLSLGPLLGKFESAFSEFIGTRYAVAVNSGTSALHLLVKALGIGEGDIVITSPFSFIASANCILYERAIPYFVDINPITYNVDIALVEDAIKALVLKSNKPKALLAVHVFGMPCNMDGLKYICERYGLRIIEDACEGVGTTWKGRRVGSIGNGGTFAFYPNKQMTTGEGGMVVTNDGNIAALCKSLRNQGRSENGGWLAHERLGYNYRLSDINCALGLAQLERIDHIIQERSKVAGYYNERLRDVTEVHTPFCDYDETLSWFVYVIRLADKYTRDDRNRILRGLKSKGIGCNNYFVPIHLQPFYVKQFGFKEGDFPVTESVAARTIALPFYNKLKEEEVVYIVKTLKELL